jgi:hypothetical protein
MRAKGTIIPWELFPSWSIETRLSLASYSIARTATTKISSESNRNGEGPFLQKRPKEREENIL